MNLLRRGPNHFFHRFQNNLYQRVRALSEYRSLLVYDRSALTNERMVAVDILEEKHRFVLRADIPGVDPSDIEVSIANGILSIKGERKIQRKEKTNGYRRVECNHGAFCRRFTLPESADPEKFAATGENGVLTITLGKQN